MYARACCRVLVGCRSSFFLLCQCVGRSPLCQSNGNPSQLARSCEHNLVTCLAQGGTPMTTQEKRKEKGIGKFFSFWLVSVLTTKGTPKKTECLFLGKNSQKTFEVAHNGTKKDTFLQCLASPLYVTLRCCFVYWV